MADTAEEQSNETIEAAGLAWLRANGRKPISLSPMAGDVSARRYFRVDGCDEVLAHYPPDLLRSYECFLRTDELLLRAGVPTPRVVLSDPNRQWMVTEDVGVRQLSEQADNRSTEAAVARAFELAQRIARLDASQVADLSPALETELLTREVRRTSRTFFRAQLGGRESETIERVLFKLCEELGQGSLVPAHRDYMARNLMLVESSRQPERSANPEGADLVVLDHQDLRLAPWGYDIASLLFDSCPLSESRSEAFADRRLDGESRLAVARCAVQRCIKIVGTFVGFAERGQARYLPMVPSALRRAAKELRLLPEANEEVSTLLETVASAMERDAGRGDANGDDEQAF